MLRHTIPLFASQIYIFLLLPLFFFAAPSNLLLILSRFWNSTPLGIEDSSSSKTCLMIVRISLSWSSSKRMYAWCEVRWREEGEGEVAGDEEGRQEGNIRYEENDSHVGWEGVNLRCLIKKLLWETRGQKKSDNSFGSYDIEPYNKTYLFDDQI